jgi:hypothetical protein
MSCGQKEASNQTNTETVDSSISKRNTKSHNNGRSFIRHLKKNINFKKCLLYAEVDYPSSSKRHKNAIEDLQDAIKSKGIKLLKPIDVMEYDGHSKDIALTKENIKSISVIYNALFDVVYEKAQEFATNKQFETNSKDFYSNGNIRSINKSFQGKRDYNQFWQENFEDGTIKSFGVKAENLYEVSFSKDYDGKLESRELAILGDKLAESSCSFKESYNTNVTYYHFSFGETVNSVNATIKNDELTSLNQVIYCSCPDDKDPDHGVSRMIQTTLIDYKEETGERKNYKYWDAGSYYQDNGDVVEEYNLHNNTYKIVDYKDYADKDTSSFLTGKLLIKKDNNQVNLYGVNSFLDGKTPIQKTDWTTDWEGSKEIKYKYTDTYYNDKGYAKETVYYFPDGKVKSRSNG